MYKQYVMTNYILLIFLLDGLDRYTIRESSTTVKYVPNWKTEKLKVYSLVMQDMRAYRTC